MVLNNVEKKVIIIALAITFLLGVGIIMILKSNANKQVSELLTKGNLGLTLPAGEDNEGVTHTPTKEIIKNKDGSTTVIDYGTIVFVYEDNIWKPVDQARSLRGSGIDCYIESDGENLVECLDWNWTSIQLRTSQRAVSVSNKQVPLRVYEYVVEPVIDSKTQQIIDYQTVERLKSEKSLSFSLLSNAKNEPVNNFEYGNVIHFGETSTTVQLIVNGSNLKDSASLSSQPQYNYGITTTINILNESQGSNRQRQEIITFNFSDASIPAGQVITDASLNLFMIQNDIDAGENANVSVYMVYNNWTVNGLDGHVFGNSNMQGGTLNSEKIYGSDTSDSVLYRYYLSNESTNGSCSTSAYNTDFRGVDINGSGVVFQIEYGTADIHRTWDNCTLINTSRIATNTPTPQAIAVNDTVQQFVVVDLPNNNFDFYFYNATYIGTCDTGASGYSTPSAVAWYNGRIYIGDSGVDKIGEFWYNCTFIGDYMELSEHLTGNGGISSLRFNSSGYMFAFDLDNTMYVYNPNKEIINSPASFPWAEGASNGASNTVIGGMTYAKRPGYTWLKPADDVLSFYTVGTSPVGTWYSWNITSASSLTYENGYENITFYLTADKVTTNELTDAINFCSKENTTVSCRPYMNITYDVAIIPDNPPVVTLNSPATSTTSFNNSYTFDCNVNDDRNVTNVTFYVWTLNDILYNVSTNYTTSVSSLNYTMNITNFVPNYYKWNCKAYDNASQYSWASSNFTLTVQDSYIADLIYPTQASPESVDVGNNITFNINFTYQNAPITSGVTINATIDDTINCPLSGGVVYNAVTELWDANCTAPIRTLNAYYPLGININTTTVGSGRSDYEFEAVYYNSDTQAPRYSGIAVNDTQPEALDLVEFYTLWTDNYALANYTFSWNASGVGCDTWANDTTVIFNGVLNWSNITKQIPASCSNMEGIAFRIYANDSYGNKNVTTTLPFIRVPTFTIKFNQIKSNFVDNSGFGSYLNFTWYNEEGLTFDYCKLEWNGTINYTGIISGSNCSYNLSGLNENNNYTFRAWGNTTTDTLSNFSTTKNVSFYYTPELIDGYWVARSPINGTDQWIGMSYPRRYDSNIGSGFDIGILWRASTDDTLGRNSTDTNTDEKRHCGAWTQYMFDEPNISAGNITDMYCHSWILSSSSGASLITSIGENGYGVNSVTGTDVDDNNLYAIPGNSSEFILKIYSKHNLNVPFYDNGTFWNLSVVYSGSEMETLSYKDQRTWCIFNTFNGASLNDNETLNNSDYDGDGLTDYQELFVTYTNPTIIDTDEDGFSDFIEYNNGKEGWNPYDWGIITKYKVNATTTLNATYSNFTYSARTIYGSSLDLNYTMSQEQKDNSSDIDNIYTSLNRKGAGTTNWAMLQKTYRFNISENPSSIRQIVMFESNKRVAQGTSPSLVNTTKFLKNYAGGDALIPGGVTLFEVINYLKIKDGISNYINQSGGNREISFSVGYQAQGGSTSGTDLSLETDWVELWIVTGGDYINLLSPSTINPLNVENGSKINVSFNFYESGVEIINGVTLQNITIDNTLCPPNNALIYNGSAWIVNCTVPDKVNGVYSIQVYANTTTKNLTQIEIYSVIYGSDTCTYSGSGDWIINCADSCIIYTNTNLNGNNLIIDGTGIVQFEASLYNMKGIVADARCRKIKNSAYKWWW